MGPGGAQHGELVEVLARLISIVTEQRQGKHCTHPPKVVNHPQRRRNQEVQISQFHLSPCNKLWRKSSRKPCQGIEIPTEQVV